MSSTTTAVSVSSLEQDILRCSRSGNISNFRALLNRVGDEILKWRHSRTGESFLLLCARYGHVALVRCLVEEFRENLEQQNNDGKRALHEAVLGGHVECVRFMIQKKVEIDSLKRADWTPLMLACTKDNLDVVVDLIQAGANPQLVNKDRWNCFHIAVREGHEEIIKYLLQMFPDIWDTVSNNGRTPLHTAALHGHLETVLILLKCGHYKADCADSCGTTPLMDALRGGHVPIAAVFITQYIGSVTTIDKLGRHCIHISSQSGSLPSLKYLVNEQNVDVNVAVDYNGMTALHIAAKEGNTEAVVFLLSVGSKINCPDKNGRTALHLSSASGQTKTVELFLKTPGIDATLRDKRGMTAEDLALKHNVQELFIRKKKTTTSIVMH